MSEKKYESMEELKKDALSCQLCDLSKTRTNVVFGKGDEEADILFIGEAPGKNEDLEGFPFVGRAGNQLDELLKMINLSIEDVYIANILKCRPPSNRDPVKEEIKTCTPYLKEQIRHINPKVIATLGNYATKFVLSGFNPDKMNSIGGITSLRGAPKKVKFNDIEFIVVPLFHPAAMLYRPQLKETMETDFNTLKKIVDGEYKNKQKTLF